LPGLLLAPQKLGNGTGGATDGDHPARGRREGRPPGRGRGRRPGLRAELPLAPPARRAGLARPRRGDREADDEQELVQKLESAELRFDVQAGETGTLFGSVTATDIADRIWETQRVRIDRRKLDLPESIKRIGRYQVPLELFTDVTATLRLAVVPEGGELPPEEELQALDAEAAEAEAAAAAEAEEARSAAEAATEAAVTEAEAEEQVPEDSFDRAVEAADEAPDEASPEQQ
jgi:large subunit ribosomal protein L9